MLAIVACGLPARTLRGHLPKGYVTYVGDLLWAALLYLLLALLLRRWPVGRLIALALAISVGIELSQLYHAPWIDGLRRVKPVALVLGHQFLWSDLLAYAGGILAAALVDRSILRRQGRRSTSA